MRLRKAVTTGPAAAIISLSWVLVCLTPGAASAETTDQPTSEEAEQSPDFRDLGRMLTEQLESIKEPESPGEAAFEVLHQGVAATGPRGVEGRYYHVCHHDVVYVVTVSGLHRPPHDGGLARSMSPLINPETGYPTVCKEY